MNTTQQRRSLPRFVSASLAAVSVATLGVGTLSAHDAAAAGVARGIRYDATSTSNVDPSALPTETTSLIRFRVTDGQLVQL